MHTLLIEQQMTIDKKKKKNPRESSKCVVVLWNFPGHMWSRNVICDKHGSMGCLGGSRSLNSLAGSVTNLLRDLNMSLYLSVPQFTHALKNKMK